MTPRANPRAGLVSLLRSKAAGPRRDLPWRIGAAIAMVAAALLWAPPRILSAQTSAPDSASAPEIGAPVGFVNDRAGVLDEPARAKLEAFLDQVKEKTGAEFGVLVVRSTAPLSPSEYKVQVFQKWGLGKKGEDNGLLMLVALEEREVRFETGYGLEGTLPDGLQSRIFREEMAPRFRTGDYAGGITAGVIACAQRIAAEKGVTLEWDGRELRYRRRDREFPSSLISGFAFLALLVMFSILRSLGGRGRRRWRGGWYVGPGGFGGGWGGGLGGGFGGGGFGGGGSFGGFGGGASGGGGGGGRW